MINKFLKKIANTNKMTADFISFIKLLFFYIYLHPIFDKLNSKSLPVKIKLKAFGNTCDFYIEKLEDLATLEGIFIKQEYDNDLTDVKNIIDLGSNIGASVAYFKLRYPDARVVAVEAEPAVFKKLQKNVEQFSSVELLQAAVGGSSGMIDFYINPKRSISGSMTDRGEGYECVKVPVRTLDSVFDEFDIEVADIVKFNIEGGEIDVFDKSNTISRIKLAIGGVHVDLIPDYKDVQLFLQKFNNFNIEKIPRAKGRFLMKAVNNRVN